MNFPEEHSIDQKKQIDKFIRDLCKITEDFETRVLNKEKKKCNCASESTLRKEFNTKNKLQFSQKVLSVFITYIALNHRLMLDSKTLLIDSRYHVKHDRASLSKLLEEIKITDLSTKNNKDRTDFNTYVHELFSKKNHPIGDPNFDAQNVINSRFSIEDLLLDSNWKWKSKRTSELKKKDGSSTDEEKHESQDNQALSDEWALEVEQVIADPLLNEKIINNEVDSDKIKYNDTPKNETDINHGLSWLSRNKISIRLICFDLVIAILLGGVITWRYYDLLEWETKEGWTYYYVHDNTNYKPVVLFIGSLEDTLYDGVYNLYKEFELYKKQAGRDLYHLKYIPPLKESENLHMERNDIHLDNRINDSLFHIHNAEVIINRSEYDHDSRLNKEKYYYVGYVLARQYYFSSKTLPDKSYADRYLLRISKGTLMKRTVKEVVNEILDLHKSKVYYSKSEGTFVYFDTTGTKIKEELRK